MIIGLIVRPLMPPVALMCWTKRSMAFTCSLYSTSPAKPNWPARAWRFATGNSTLMECAVTPRVLVLAWVTGVNPEEAALPGVSARSPPASATHAAASVRSDLPQERAT